MSSLFYFKDLFERIKRFSEQEHDLKPESFLILKEAFINGKIKRGDVPKISGLA